MKFDNMRWMCIQFETTWVRFRAWVTWDLGDQLGFHWHGRRFWWHGSLALNWHGTLVASCEQLAHLSAGPWCLSAPWGTCTQMKRQYNDNPKTIQRQCKDKAQEDPTHMSTSPWLRISLLGSRGPGLWTGGWDFVATCEIPMNCQLWTVMKLFYSSVLPLAENACNGNGGEFTI